jgi:hypothetical protein
VQPAQPVQLTQSKAPQPQPFPSEHKSAVIQHAYNDTPRSGWKDDDFDEDEARDWRESWGIK